MGLSRKWQRVVVNVLVVIFQMAMDVVAVVVAAGVGWRAVIDLVWLLLFLLLFCPCSCGT